jgi:hypothetical protein
MQTTHARTQEVLEAKLLAAAMAERLVGRRQAGLGFRLLVRMLCLMCRTVWN